MLDRVDHFLERHPFERGLWLVVGFAAGIAGWIALPSVWHWLSLLAALSAVALVAVLGVDAVRWPHLRLAIFGMAVMAGAGCGTIWMKSALVGQPGIARPVVADLHAILLERREEPAKGRTRLLLQVRLAEFARPVRVRVNLGDAEDRPEIAEGAVLRLRARLMPPAPPMLPGAYDFARTAWFDGIAATGTVLGKVAVITPSSDGPRLRSLQRSLAAHVRANLSGSPGAIAAALASGDRGAIARGDEDAMRDAGLTHLLSISGLHVSALVGAVYWLVARLLALVPWIALRIRVPIAAALAGALAGIAYTLLTGAEVPTIRSCIGALLVLVALALGRDPLSMRMVAAGAMIVMLFWPEALLGPSFQMSFAAVIAIIAFHSAAPVRGFLAGDHHGTVTRLLRGPILLLATGVVIELALMPIGLFHFHRAGVYGALANVIAIPLTTFVIMPLVGLALMLDLAGGGAPVWWCAGKSLEALLALAHFVASQPGAAAMLPASAPSAFAVFVAGMLWLALWTGPVRYWGALPAAVAVAAMVLAPAPDILVTGDGRHVALVAFRDVESVGAAVATPRAGGNGLMPELVLLRAGRSDYVRENLIESAGIAGQVRAIDDWPDARCSEDFCSAVLVRRDGAGRQRHLALLLSRSAHYVDDLALAAACEKSDIVISDRRLPASCRPRLLKADRAFLARSGGLAISLAPSPEGVESAADASTGHKPLPFRAAELSLRTVSQTQDRHGWYPWPPSERASAAR
ncbi:MAG: ComEC/Rec2 family competence protein [Novosphingobium sp.]